MSLILFKFLDELLQYIRNSSELYGGIQLIFAMDPLQCTVLMPEKELANIKKYCRSNLDMNDLSSLKCGFYHSKSIFGRNWFYGILSINIRSNNIEWSKFLCNARRSELTEEDFIWFLKYSGSLIPSILKTKWLLINYTIRNLHDLIFNNGATYHWRKENNWILTSHDDKIKTIENILELDKSRESKGDISNVINIHEVYILAPEKITVEYGNMFDHDIICYTEKINEIVFDCTIKILEKKYSLEKYEENTKLEYIRKWEESGLKKSLDNILKDIKSYSANNSCSINNSGKINMPGLIECTAEDSFILIENLTERNIDLNPEEKKYYSKLADSQNKQQHKLSIAKGSIVINKSNSQLYIHSNQRLMVIEQIGDTLSVEPLYSGGLKSPNRLIKRELRQFEVAGQGRYSNKIVIVKRLSYPIVINSALMVGSTMGLQFDAALFDNTRFVDEGQTYIAAGRVPSPAAFGLLHLPKSLKDMNEKYFKCNLLSKKLDTYLNDVKKKTNSNVIRINFEFDYNGNIIKEFD
jgi:hypothetical protein